MRHEPWGLLGGQPPRSKQPTLSNDIIIDSHVYVYGGISAALLEAGMQCFCSSAMQGHLLLVGR